VSGVGWAAGEGCCAGACETRGRTTRATSPGSSISAWGCPCEKSVPGFLEPLGLPQFPLEMADAQEALHTRDELDAVDRLAEELVGAAIDARS